MWHRLSQLLRTNKAQVDIYIPPTEGSLVGIIPGLRGRKAVQEVIDILTGGK
jgi:hypothetical protein